MTSSNGLKSVVSDYGESTILKTGAVAPENRIMVGDSYATPSWLLELFNGWYDPCPFNLNPTEDGLEKEWGGKSYVNPPYSKPLPWVKKAIEEMQKGKLIVMLLKSDTSTEVFRLCHQYGEVFFPARRIKYNGKSPDFASMLVIFNGKEVRHSSQD